MKKLIISLFMMLSILLMIGNVTSRYRSASISDKVNQSNLLAVSGATNKKYVSAKIEKTNDDKKPIKQNPAGKVVEATILNTINTGKSDLANGIVAIDITVESLSVSREDLTGIGVEISFDQYILNNFTIEEISQTGGQSAQMESNVLKWTIAEIKKGNSAVLSYKLKLKDTVYNDAIGRRLNTNRQIVVKEWGSTVGTFPENAQIGIQECGPVISLTKVDPTGSLKVRKVVTGDGADNNKYFNFTVTLNSRLNGQYGGMNFENGVARFTLKNGGEMVADNLPVGTTYIVVETDANQNHYNTTSTTNTGEIAEDETKEVVFTNNYVRPVGSLKVTKKTDGDAAETQKNFSFTVTLSESVTENYGEMEFKDGVAKFELSNGNSKTASGIPIEYTYTVVEDSANKDGYVTIYDNGSGKKTTDKVSGSIKEGDTVNITVTNTKNSKKYINIHKEFDTTTNLENDVTIGYSNLTSSELSLADYKKYVSGKDLVIIASKEQTHTNFTVKADSNGNIKIPSRYAKEYTDYKTSVEVEEGKIDISFKIEASVPTVPESLDFHIKAGSAWEQDFTLKSNESWAKSFEINFDTTALKNIVVTEKNSGSEWSFDYTSQVNEDDNTTILMVNTGGKYLVSGNVNFEENPKVEQKLSLKKVWDLQDNNIDIYFTSKNRNDFKVEVKVLDKNNKVLETLTLDETGHGVTKNKYSAEEEIYVQYPDGKKVKVDSFVVNIPESVKIKVGSDEYVLDKNNNWRVSITGTFSDDIIVEEVGEIPGFETKIVKTKDEENNYTVTVTNSYKSLRSVSYEELLNIEENPKTGITSYVVAGGIMVLISILTLSMMKRINFFNN